MRARCKLLVLMAALAAAGPVRAQSDAGKTLAAFEGELEHHDSATAVLQAWCDAHAPAGTRIVARQVEGGPPAPAQALQALGIGAADPLRHRRVELACGDKVLSRADNWYLPAALTPQMNMTLDTSQTPFGVAVASLHFTRRNLQTTVLYQGGPVPPEVLRHAAVLTTGQGRPFSYVVETYTDQVVGR